MKLADWEKELAEVMPFVKEVRRKLHRHPEVGGEEIWTREFLEETLHGFGLETTRFEDTCCVMTIIEGARPGKCVAIRADIDALPIQEETGLPFASEIPGRMHACGHDAHMALALGTAKYLSSHREKFAGTVKFFFEAEEETRGGAKLMADQGCLENPRVDWVIGQHMNPRYAAGVFFAKPGFVSGASDEVEITVRGKSCHGAYPESGVDAIVIAAQVVTALQTMVSRTISPLDSAVLTLGTVQGGKACNIICGEVRMTGTLRTLSDKTRGMLKERIAQLASGVAQGMGGDAEVVITPGYGAVYNDDALYARMEPLAVELLGEDKIVRREMPSLGVESFGYFQKDTPGVYYDLGSGVGTALHTSTFRVDEDCLLPGVAMQCATVLELLKP